MQGEREFEQELCFPSDTAEGHRVQEMLLARLENLGYSNKVIFGIKLAIEEALVNAIKHGNRLDKSKMVTVKYSINDEHFHVQIEDQGQGFRPEEVPDPTSPENLERPCGRGLLLMRAYMTECEFLPPGNKCRMRRVKG